MSTTTDLSVLKINYLTQAQYDSAKSQGTLEANEIYMTPVSNPGVEDVEVDGVSVVTDGVAEITMPTVPTKVSDLQNDENFTSNTGTVTSVTVSNATNGGLTISGSPVTTSGTVTVGHSNVLTSAQTTQAVYPIKIDKNGHISAYGSAVTSMPASDVSSWAKAANKPTYTASEVGALPDSTSIPTITVSGTNLIITT